MPTMLCIWAHVLCFSTVDPHYSMPTRCLETNVTHVENLWSRVLVWALERGEHEMRGRERLKVEYVPKVVTRRGGLVRQGSWVWALNGRVNRKRGKERDSVSKIEEVLQIGPSPRGWIAPPCMSWVIIVTPFRYWTRHALKRCGTPKH